ncbi:MAG: NAD(P)/FAD-dependent oxidoreductase [Planctomycetota bacterium]|jgi:NAD(P)H-nitrite reductase large subunit
MRILILGAGPAGLTAAERIRELEPADDEFEITMISSEPFPPYSPPAMADHFLTGRTEKLFWRGDDICDRLRVHYRAGVRAEHVDAADKWVLLDDGYELSYDKLVIATGSRPWTPLPGNDLDGVYNFKSLVAAEELVRRARQGEVGSAVIVGAGFIGVEVALLLRALGLDVTMIERYAVMPRMLDQETAELVRHALVARGIDVRINTSAASFVKRGHRATGVALESGEVMEADVYIAATGVRPNIEFLAASGMKMDWGVAVDETLATSLPDVWAAGDVAETVDRMTGERFVHAIWPNATAQGRIVADRILGYDSVYEGAESMNSLRHLGLPLIAAGVISGDSELRWRRDGVLRKIVLDEGRIVGYRLSGDIRGAGLYRSLMLKRADVSACGEDLLDPGFGIGMLVPPATAPAHLHH